MSEAISDSRPMSPMEGQPIRWMLEQSGAEAKQFLDQLESARATSWQCPCGCASFNLTIEGRPAPAGGMHILADFLFGNDDDDLSGVFVWEQNGVLAGLEVYGLTGDAPKSLPAHESLRPFGQR